MKRGGRRSPPARRSCRARERPTPSQAPALERRPAQSDIRCAGYGPQTIRAFKRLPECREALLDFRIVLRVAHQRTDPTRSFGLLRARRKRPCSSRTPPRRLMNSRRRISAPKLRGQHCIGSNEYFDRGRNRASKPLPRCTANVSDGSKARITAPQHCCPLRPPMSRPRQDEFDATLRKRIHALQQNYGAAPAIRSPRRRSRVVSAAW